MVTRREATESVRRRIIEAAIGQLADEGMRGLTHRKVGDRAGTTLGLVRYHFGSLAGLIEAVLERMVELQLDNVMELSDETKRDIELLGTDSPALRAQATQTMNQILDQSGLQRARFELLLHASRHPELQDVIRTSRDAFVARVGEQMQVPNPAAAARMILAMIDGLSLHQLSGFEPAVQETTPDMLIAVAAASGLLPAREMHGET